MFVNLYVTDPDFDVFFTDWLMGWNTFVALILDLEDPLHLEYCLPFALAPLDRVKVDAFLYRQAQAFAPIRTWKIDVVKK